MIPFMTSLRSRGLLLIGCMTMATQPVPGFNLSESGSALYQVEADLPLLSRVGLWDTNAQDFELVSNMPGYNVTGGNVYFITHGWAPGYRTAVDNDPSLRAWSPGLLDDGVQYGAWFSEMAAMIEEVDPGATVMAYSWVDDSATNNTLEAYQSEAKTTINGTRLAAAMGEILDSTFDGKVHVLGHSHGSKVATLASIHADQRPNHLTVLDSPEGDLLWFVGASNNLPRYLPTLEPGRSPDALFMDNYYSMFGEAYNDFPGLSGIVDIELNPQQYSEFAFSERHSYPIRWYTEASPDALQANGLLWSPLLGNLYETLAPSYYQNWTYDPPLSMNELELEVVAETTPASQWIWNAASLETVSMLGDVQFDSETGRVTLGVDGDNEPLSLWHTTFEMTGEMLALEFEYRFTEGSNGEQVAVWIGDELRFLAASDLPGADGFLGVIDLTNLDPGTWDLVLGLYQNGDFSAMVEVDGMQFALIPEPSSLLLVAIVMSLVGLRRPPRRDRAHG